MPALLIWVEIVSSLSTAVQILSACLTLKMAVVTPLPTLPAHRPESSVPTQPPHTYQSRGIALILQKLSERNLAGGQSYQKNEEEKTPQD